MSQAQGQHRDLIQSIEGLPSSQGPSPLDQDLLLLKATSLATMTCLSDCLHILQLQQVARQKIPLAGEIFLFYFLSVSILVLNVTARAGLKILISRFYLILISKNQY